MNRRDFIKKTCTGLAATAFFNTACQPSPKTAKPNIIFILADDLGYGDLSCYGQKKFSTPNIDKLAEKGLMFTQHYSGSTVCAPSRSALLTGLHTGHTPVRGNKEVKPEGQWPMPGDTFTLTKMLKQSGYTTGVFGKWGLGYPGSEGDPNNQGVDEFFGYNCQRLAHHYYPHYLWHNQEKVVIEENSGFKTGVYGPSLIHERAVNFIRQNSDTPFFLFYSSLIPHAELFAPEEVMQKYRDKFLPEKQYQGKDEGPGYRKGGYGSQDECHAAFAAMIHVLDVQVGELVATLEQQGLLENTLIVFSSDNGPHVEGGADPDYFDSNGPLKGYKRDLYEGGIRVPMIVRWDGKIKPGQTTDHISAFWDFMPTVSEIVAYGKPLSNDGVSFLPTLTGQGEQKVHDYLYWEFHERGGRQAVRMGQWKGVKYNVFQGDAEIELYDLSKDIGETNNIANQHPDRVEKIQTILKDARTESEVFNFQARAYKG